jgi:hypothetical protein
LIKPKVLNRNTSSSATNENRINLNNYTSSLLRNTCRGYEYLFKMTNWKLEEIEEKVMQKSA